MDPWKWGPSGVTKVADALRDGGALVIVSTHHVAGGDTAFFNQVQACNDQLDPTTPPGLTLPLESEIPHETGELKGSARFDAVTVRRYPWEKTYTAAEYEELLLSYSGHRAMKPWLSLEVCETGSVAASLAGAVGSWHRRPSSLPCLVSVRSARTQHQPGAPGTSRTHGGFTESASRFPFRRSASLATNEDQHPSRRHRLTCRTDHQDGIIRWC
jgi:hypothetical protein